MSTATPKYFDIRIKIMRISGCYSPDIFVFHGNASLCRISSGGNSLLFGVLADVRVGCPFLRSALSISELRSAFGVSDKFDDQRCRFRGVGLEQKVAGVEDVGLHARQGLDPGENFGAIEERISRPQSRSAGGCQRTR
ncbi:hypothetical protein AB4Z34_31615 [Ensifer sp. 2YAB10]|uniref:hypothetical protein n=1 Tax=unclassified Ensifer TaxID=2633371 RepID=UPI003F8F84D5